MVIEIARFQVAPGQHKGIFNAFADVKAYVGKAEGYLWKCHKNDGKWKRLDWAVAHR